MRYVALFVILGLLLGIGFGSASNAGYFERWEETEPAPAPIEELVISGQGSVFARTTTGETYSCALWRDECWFPAEIPSFDDDPYPTTVTKPCNLDTPAFFPLTNPPSDIVDCTQDYTMYADGWMEHSYVLDAQGLVWEWSHGESVYSAGGAYILFPCSGMLLGLAAGGGVVWWKRRGRRQAHG
ncbi:MAG TPA: hypothetical protein VLC95_15295 [Anaerolineae bacterium]|nr:hypothetical protein [Anaerolineae bacterium]